MFTPFNVERVRADFPILRQPHPSGKPLVYLDTAASAQKPNAVIEAESAVYRSGYANVHRGIHYLSEQATAAYEGARDTVRRFINAASRREIVFTRGTTESINLVVQTWGRANLNPGDVVVTSVMEHHANIVPWQILAAERGFTIRYVPVTASGELDMDALRSILKTEPVKMVSLMHISNVLGTINPIAEVARMAHEIGALMLVDAAQSVPHMPVDVRALDVDFLAFSGHKAVGPSGIGVLYGRRALLDAMPPWMGGGDMIARVTLEGSTWNELPYKFEAGTPAIAQAIGLGAALDYLSSLGMESVHQAAQDITRYALERLSETAGLKWIGPPDDMPRGALVSFTLNDVHPHDLAQLLDMEGVAVRAGHHCAMPLHSELGLNATARASFGPYTTRDEIDSLVSALHQARKVFQR
jgi:cysteine desulfurase/selenocysteine lyase